MMTRIDRRAHACHTSSTRTIAFAAMLLLLASCGEAPIDPQDLNSLDAELTNGTTRDPALSAALADQIMVDPGLSQSSNDDVIRPPTRPATGAVPADDIAALRDPVDPGTLKKAPAATGDCAACRTADGALTLGALAERQTRGDAAACGARVGYSAAWANRLPAELAVYPGARVSEAAGTDDARCGLRIVSFAASAPVQKMLDYYYTRASGAGYSAEHRSDGKQHVLGGVRGNDAYVVYVTARAGGGSDVDMVSNAGR